MMTNHIKTPVVLFVFRRVETTAKLLDRLREVKPPVLLVVADGPRPQLEGEATKCAAVRKLFPTFEDVP